MIDREDKQLICNLLIPALRATVSMHDLISLRYDAKSEIVTAEFASGGKKTANVAMDSGIAMIKDILRQIE